VRAIDPGVPARPIAVGQADAARRGAGAQRAHLFGTTHHPASAAATARTRH